MQVKQAYDVFVYSVIEPGQLWSVSMGTGHVGICDWPAVEGIDWWRDPTAHVCTSNRLTKSAGFNIPYTFLIIKLKSIVEF